MRRHIEFVTKISKHCNLRCTYCYEYNDLAKTRRMSLDDMESMFRNIRSYCSEHCERTLFIWHGGEPLLIKPAYYEKIGELQKDVLGDATSCWNVTQTNLTVLTDELIDFLDEERFFLSCGVSVDPFGSERVDVHGRLRSPTVFNNMQRLIDRDIAFGAITVLSRATVDYVEETFRFFDTLGVGFRALPYYLSASNEQLNTHALTYEEIINAFKDLFDLWLQSKNGIRISPLYDYMSIAIQYLNSDSKFYKDLWDDEVVFTVDLDGNVWGESGMYDPSARYGNIFEQSLEDVLGSETRRRVCAESDKRIEAHCRQCPYHGACPGDYVMNASAEQRHLLETSGCPVREMVSHILSRFEETDLVDRIREAGVQARDDEPNPVDAAIARA